MNNPNTISGSSECDRSRFAVRSMQVTGLVSTWVLALIFFLVARQSAMSKLLSPLKFHGATLSNRLVLAPMTRARAGPSRVPNSIITDYYAQRASAGLLITEATAISPQGYGWNGAPAIYTDEHAAGWKNVTEAVHKKGGKIFVQLWHMGRQSHSDYQPNNALPVAPSAIAASGDAHVPSGKKPYEVPHALEIGEIKLIVDDFRNAAVLAKSAGFDGVEIHGANGYLIDEFLQSSSNQRTDQYGGSVENRYRFLGEIVDAVKTVLPSTSIGVRISPNGVYGGMGSSDFREQFSFTVAELAKHDLAYLHVMDGLGFGFHNLGEPFTLADARKWFKGIIIGNVGYTKETAEAAVASGNADMIAFGRPYISNPDLAERFANNWPLNPDATYPQYYSGGADGYTDFPVHSD